VSGDVTVLTRVPLPGSVGRAGVPRRFGHREQERLKVGRTRAFKQTGALAAGTFIGGVLAYAFFALATRVLGARDAAPISILWSYWIMVAAVLTFPLQHWTIRLLTEGAEGTLARSRKRIWVGTGVGAGLCFVVAWVAREPLFHDRTLAFPVMMASITAGAALTGLVRGGLAGRGRFAATGASLALENLVRVALAAVVALVGGGAEAFGLALVVGSLSGLMWPSSLRLDRSSTATSKSIVSPVALASGLVASSLIAQIVLTGGPVALAALGGTPRHVTALFLGLAVWRAPYLICLGVAPQLTAVLTRMALDGAARRLRRNRIWAGLAVLGAAALAVLAGATFFVPAVRLVFGSELGLDGVISALIGVGTVLAIGNMALLLLMLALGTPRPANRAWLLAVLVMGFVLAAAPLGPLDRVVAAFVAAELTAFVLLMLSRLPAAARATSHEGADITTRTPQGM